MDDWTAKNNVSNSSDEYEKYVDIIDNIIRDSAYFLINGRSIIVARLILSQLAHKYKFRPYN